MVILTVVKVRLKFQMNNELSAEGLAGEPRGHRVYPMAVMITQRGNNRMKGCLVWRSKQAILSVSLTLSFVVNSLPLHHLNSPLFYR